MPIEPGVLVAHYRIAAAIGAGGMGEVYRATDTRLGRDVALKVLPAEVGADPERLGRFEREARAVAALNHPNIVTLYSIEESEGVRFLTMEVVEGLWGQVFGRRSSRDSSGHCRSNPPRRSARLRSRSSCAGIARAGSAVDDGISPWWRKPPAPEPVQRAVTEACRSR
jgi:serine/threonine protein kinase